MVRRPPGIELALLGFLNSGPQHGYQIHVMLSGLNGLGTIWNIKQSQLYALLAKLEDDGYIEGELEIPTGAHPPRRTFRLTVKGRSEFEQWVSAPVESPRQIRQEFMAKLYFALQDGADSAKLLLRLQSAVCQKWIKKFSDGDASQVFYISLVNQYRIGQISAMLQWLDSVQAEMNASLR